MHHAALASFSLREASSSSAEGFGKVGGGHGRSNPKMSMEIPLPGSDLMANPLSSQFGQLSLQDKAFLDAFNRQEQQELHGVPRPGPVDPTTLLGQLEQVTTD